MKKVTTLFLTSIILSSPVFAEDTAPTDEWSDISEMSGAWDGQKIITDDLFEKVIEQKTKYSKEKQEKKQKKKFGEAIAPVSADMGNLMSLDKMAEDYPTLLVPKTLVFNDTEIPIGFYRVISANTTKGKYINFYQGNSLIGQILAKETEDDFNTETINYAKIIFSETDNSAKLIYGCLDYNLIAEITTK